MQFQIRDDTFGLALYDAPTAADALLAFLCDRSKTALRAKIEQDAAHGVASIEHDGTRYSAVPVYDPAEVS